MCRAFAGCNVGALEEKHRGNPAIMPVLLVSALCNSKACDHNLLLEHLESVPAVCQGQDDEATTQKCVCVCVWVQWQRMCGKIFPWG